VDVVVALYQFGDKECQPPFLPDVWHLPIRKCRGWFHRHIAVRKAKPGLRTE